MLLLISLIFVSFLVGARAKYESALSLFILKTHMEVIRPPDNTLYKSTFKARLPAARETGGAQ